MRKKIVIFDLDGTLLNTLKDLTISTNYALKACNYPLRTVDEVRQFVGNGVYKLIERAVPSNSSSYAIDKCLTIFKKHYSENMYNNTAPYEGIIDLLKSLKQKGYIVAVVSNKFDNAVKDLCEKYFAGLVDFAAGENEKLGIKKKPAPDTVFQVLKKYDLSSKEAVYIGDSEVDVATAAAAGLPCICVLWGFRDRDQIEAAGGKTFVHTPEELYPEISKLLNSH
jgi:phosphoglycolate phosphatase